MGELWLVCSVTTDWPDGFTAENLRDLRDLLPLFAVAAKATTLRVIQQGLLAAYLGDDPAQRVLAGTVLRGKVQGVEAVIYYADLRGFTELADRLDGSELITLLDDCLECMGRPVVTRGGEILKFLGDGVLAIFRTDDRPRVDACTKALDAACEALSSMQTLERSRRAAGKPAPGLDIALHVGHVHYGNVGVDARLDFTVIGRAVNEAARIELLCKELGRNLLLSHAFAAAAGTAGRRLMSLGRHSLRGVREDTELFGLV